MTISINSNSAALRSQRSIHSATEAVEQSSQRLASGLRINRPSDDAAGLAIASSLNVNSRIFGKAIQNLNDGISALSIAEGATGELSSLVIRLKELSEQSASGTLGQSQRKTLNAEAQALRKEFNRIIDTTSFNGIRLISEGTGSIRLEAGSTRSDGGIVLNSSNLRTGGRGTGSFGAARVYDGSTTSSGTDIATGDLNDDGYLDQVVVSNATTISVMLGNGDGTFKKASTFASSGAAYVALADANGDGRLDVLSGSTSGFRVHMANSDGSLASGANYTVASGSVNQLSVGDFNGDGIKDVVLGFSATSRVDIFLGQGQGGGTFKAALSISLGSTGPLAVGDLNGDGKDDLALGSGATSKIATYYGTESGALSTGAQVQLSGGVFASGAMAIADFNGDGRLDIAAGLDTGDLVVALGNGNGTFVAGTVSATGKGVGSITGLVAGDMNGDGRADLIFEVDGIGYPLSSVNLMGSSGSIASSYLLDVGYQDVTLADLDGDGALDLSGVDAELTAGASPFYVSRGDAASTSYIQSLDLTSRSGALAALRMLDSAHSNLLQGIGRLGAERSRVEVGLNVLGVTKEAFLGAESRIIDVDVAEESSRYIRSQILQQGAASILGQTNLQPALALSLIVG